MDDIDSNLADIRAKIAASAEKSGRQPEAITLIGVTKTIGADRIKVMQTAGVNDFGENKVQEILAKYPDFPDVRFHMIGHLQTNKVKSILDKVAMIHSVDSIKLAEEIAKKSSLAGKTTDILIEINIAGEESKYGVAPESAGEFALNVSAMAGVRLRGLMCVAPFVENPEQNRAHFRRMKQLFVDIRAKMNNNINMNHLSMGMTNDYEIAIEEGATIVRIGTGIFGERVYL
ncbi:MAG: YggS family pyridoxal phosphate-dependent enzyme [Clostridiales bacterium]|jgi:pyridoxal phosphate enzyme (YggS family)|nr:YggS family pyridoxal phosphate-dependent enzyme [Clostridiales bacterium]